MVEIVRKTVIGAPARTCFDLSRDVDDHMESMADTGERIIGGKLHGLLGPGDEMTAEARHLGVRFRLTARITEFDSPTRFVDQMVSGPFKSLWHEHRFDPVENGTLVTDTMHVSLRWGPVGWVGERFVLPKVLGRVLDKRHAHIKRKAEARMRSA